MRLAPILHSQVQMTAGCPGLSEANVPAHGKCSFSYLLSALPSRTTEASEQAGRFISLALLEECYDLGLQSWRRQV